MKQKKIINILIVVASSSLLLLIWFSGLDGFYGRMLASGANIVLSPWPDTHIDLELQNSSPVFIVETIFEGVKGSFPQEGKLFLMPLIMIVTWQILLFFNINVRQAIKSSVTNIAIFYLIQVVFLLLLTLYYKSDFAKFMFDLMLDSFYILALFLIVKDTIRYRLIRISQSSK